MKYIHYFETTSAFEIERNGNYTEPWVSYTDGQGIDYNDIYIHMPLTFEFVTSGKITWTLGTKTIQCSINNGAWESKTGNTVFNGNVGDELKFKGLNNKYGIVEPGSTVPNITSTAKFIVKGNLMSIIAGDNFENANTLTEDDCFRSFFAKSKVISAVDLKFPTELSNSYCFTGMFSNCIDLVSGPLILPATNLKNFCYSSMFNGCTSLINAPILPATQLFANCYYNMFTGCTQLNYINAMFITEPSDSYTKGWVNNVSSTGTFVKNSEATWDVVGTNGVPSGWTVETAAE